MRVRVEPAARSMSRPLVRMALMWAPTRCFSNTLTRGFPVRL